MIVCHCKAVNDRTISDTILSGAATRCGGRALQAGSKCGGASIGSRRCSEDRRPPPGHRGRLTAHSHAAPGAPDPGAGCAIGHWRNLSGLGVPTPPAPCCAATGGGPPCSRPPTPPAPATALAMPSPLGLLGLDDDRHRPRGLRRSSPGLGHRGRARRMSDLGADRSASVPRFRTIAPNGGARSSWRGRRRWWPVDPASHVLVRSCRRSPRAQASGCWRWRHPTTSPGRHTASSAQRRDGHGRLPRGLGAVDRAAHLAVGHEQTPTARFGRCRRSRCGPRRRARRLAAAARHDPTQLHGEPGLALGRR
jgi:hypothetical protein